MKTHELKCHPHFFAAIAAGKKTFEIRRNDRDYRIGDMLNLRRRPPPSPKGSPLRDLP